VQAIPDTDAATRDAQAKTIADPVAVSSSAQTSAGDYGAGLAPFFAALAGWIGIYALFLIVKPISRRAVTALRSPVRVTIAGWLTPALLGSVGMVALFGVLSFALGFRFANPLGTLGILMLASFTYAAIILALNVWLGSVGQFVGLVLMVLQLVTAGGTFPGRRCRRRWRHCTTCCRWATVDAMRQLMYGGDLARAGTDIGVLLLWLGGALALAAVGVTRMTHRRTLRDLQPSLIG
jgi:putative membrane protein